MVMFHSYVTLPEARFGSQYQLEAFHTCRAWPVQVDPKWSSGLRPWLLDGAPEDGSYSWMSPSHGGFPARHGGYPKGPSERGMGCF